MPATPIQRAARASHRLAEFATRPRHHIVSAPTSDFAASKDAAHKAGAKLVTGTAKHFVAHFDDHAKSRSFHNTLHAAGHASAVHQTVSEACPVAESELPAKITSAADAHPHAAAIGKAKNYAHAHAIYTAAHKVCTSRDGQDVLQRAISSHPGHPMRR